MAAPQVLAQEPRAATAPPAPPAKPSGFLENYGAKLWNVANESKSFVALTLLVGVPFLAWVVPSWRASLGDALVAAAVAGSLAFVMTWHDHPLRLRALLWGWLAIAGGAYVASFGVAALAAPVALALGWFFFFTLVVWGTIYYHFLTKEPWSTSAGFWKLVMTNDDSTSGNFQQVIPQILAPALLWRVVAQRPEAASPAILGGSLAALALAFVATGAIHRAWHARVGTRDHPTPEPLLPDARASRVIIVNIDGCRADRARDPADAQMPWLDHLAANGLEVVGMRTMYPARTSVAFSTLLTGRPPDSHGVNSNFCFRPVRGETLFDRLERAGKKGIAIGIAHLYDIGHANWNIRSLTSFVKNEEADDIFLGATRDVIEKEDPDFLIVDLISVDQTGHMRGSLGDDYKRALEATDAKIREFTHWLQARGFFDDGILIVMSDHGQGRGIGGHGYWGKGEVEVPFLAYGKGVPRGVRRIEQRSLLDVTPTIAHALGV